MTNQLRRREALPLVLASLAVVIGCVLLASVGAPLRMIAINFAALLIGLSIVFLLGLLRKLSAPPSSGDWALLALALSVPATALFGQAVDGVSRWVVIAGLTLQPAMIAVAPIVCALAARPSALRAVSAVVVAVGVALQPDPAAALMLWLGAAALLVRLPSDRRWITVAVAVAAALAMLIAWARAPLLPPVPFVEDVIQRALSSGGVPLALLLAGALMLLLPAIFAASQKGTAALGFAATWAGGLLASVGGSYPTPVLLRRQRSPGLRA